MKLSETNRLIGLTTERRRLVCLLDEMRHGAELEASVGGWAVTLDDELVDALVNVAERDAQARLDAVEQEIAAMGVEIDVPRAEYLTYNENIHECECDVCAAARAELGLDDDVEVAA